MGQLYISDAYSIFLFSCSYLPSIEWTKADILSVAVSNQFVRQITSTGVVGRHTHTQNLTVKEIILRC